MTTRIAHDLNELLAPLCGSAFLLDEEISKDHALRDCVDSIHKALANLREFAEALMGLDVGRRLSLELADLGTVVRDALPKMADALGPSVRVRSSTIHPGAKVRVERDLIEQVLGLLAKNAREAMPEGGEVEIDVAEVSGGGPSSKLPDGRWIRLRVQDSGRGIEPGERARIFDPFVTHKIAGRGSGLGLTRVFVIARQHGGWVDAESRPGVGEGAAISIYLPSAQEAQEGAVATQTEPAMPEAPGTLATILLVEDNDMVRRALSEFLRKMRYRVISAGSGGECLESIRDASLAVDLLVTDIIMPEMNGHQLIERVRAMRPGLPVLFMSGYDSPTLVARRLKGPDELFLQKPFDFEELATAVRHALGWSPLPSRRA